MNFEWSDYQAVSELIQAATGLKIDSNRLDDLGKILNNIMASGGLTGIHSLMLALSQNPITHPFWQQIINLVAIGETYFFRNKDQFQALQQAVLPEIIASKQQSGFKSLRLWSAGCSTGEEPYSLAILLRELIPDLVDWVITIYATDLNMNSLEYARRGSYSSRSFRLETRPDIQDRWFAAQDKNYELDAVVRRMVTFMPLNLMAGEYPSYETGLANLDLIICRNVTIYFKEAVTRQIVHRFYESLGRGGWLVVGHAEPMNTVYQDFEVRNYENAIFYQKPYHPVSVPVPSLRPAPVVKPLPVAERPPEPDFNVMLDRAKCAADREDWATALQLLTLIEQDGQMRMRPQVHYLRGLILAQTDDADGALQAMRRAVYCDPTFALAHYTLGDLYEKRGDFRSAERYWRLSQQSLSSLDSQQRLPLAEDLTVDMLNELLAYKLQAIVDKRR